MEKSEKQSVEQEESTLYEKLQISREDISTIVNIIEESTDTESKISKFSEMKIKNLREVVVAAYIFFIDEAIGKSYCYTVEHKELSVDDFSGDMSTALVDNILSLSLDIQRLRVATENSFLCLLVSLPILMAVGSFDLAFIIELIQYVVRRDKISLEEFVQSSDRAISLYLLNCETKCEKKAKPTKLH